MPRNEYGRTSITDPAGHDWLDGTSLDEQRRDLIYLLVEDYGPICQHSLTLEIEHFLDLKHGTAAAVVCTALLALHVDGKIRFTGERERTESGRPSNVWAVATDG